MKKVNYLYFIFLLLLCPAIDYLLEAGTRISPWFLLILPIYITWLICSQFFLYWIRKKLPLKSSFQPDLKCQLEWSTFWLDKENRELAALFLFHPFKVQYIPAERIESAAAYPEGLSEDKSHAQCINFCLVIDGKKYTMCGYSMGRFDLIDMQGYGSSFLKETQRFADDILKVKHRFGTLGVISVNQDVFKIKEDEKK